MSRADPDSFRARRGAWRGQYPQAHDLESWGDARSFDGTVTLRQPLINQPEVGILGFLLQRRGGERVLEVGTGSGYHSVFRDGDLYRMYYHAWHLEVKNGRIDQPHRIFGAYCESKDGLTWTKPAVGVFEFSGSKKNNIVLQGIAGPAPAPWAWNVG